MQVRSRIKKLESKFLITKQAQNEYQECNHPSQDFKFRLEYPATGYKGTREVIKGHCNICGFDDFLWSYNALSEEQEAKRRHLKQTSQFWESMAYDLELIEQGLICYVPYSRIEEVQDAVNTRLTETMEQAAKRINYEYTKQIIEN